MNLKKHVRRAYAPAAAGKVTQMAMKNKVKVKTFPAYKQDRYDLLTFLANVEQKVRRVLKLRTMSSAVKWYTVARVQLYREGQEENEHTTEPYFKSVTNRLLTPNELLNHDLNEAFQKVVGSLEKYIHESSGWRLKWF